VANVRRPSLSSTDQARCTVFNTHQCSSFGEPSRSRDIRGRKEMSGILFIDAEQPFADQTTSALRARGFSVTLMDDGKEGLDVAAADRPDLIVLCVELPKMSGYSICNKLKKDNDLKGIPLIITSKEATPETFAQHKKLKTRAEDYLIKPFSEADLLEKIGALIALPDGSGSGSSGGSVGGGSSNDFADLGLDSELDLDNTASLNSADLDALDSLDGLDGLDALEPPPRAPTAAPAPSLDDDSLSGLDDGLGLTGSSGLDSLDDSLSNFTDDLEMPGSVKDDSIVGLDDALDALDPEPAPPPPPAPAAAAPPPRAAPVVPPPTPRVPTPAPSFVSATNAADLQALQQARRENSDLKTRVAELEARLKQAEEQARAAASMSTPPTSASSAREVLTLKQQLRAKDDEILQKESALVEVQEQLEQLQIETGAKLAEAGGKDVEISTLKARVDALADERDALEAQVRGRLQQAEAERDGLRGEVASLRGEVEAVRNESESLRHAVQDAGARANELHAALDESKKSAERTASRLRTVEGELREKEQDATKAYGLLKQEEQLRDKARQAAELAVKLLKGDVDTSGFGLEA
jgi:DNA-binding response OmpR family regulator/predicted  nucleic acid-binding Zn-ribbon protein